MWLVATALSITIVDVLVFRQKELTLAQRKVPYKGKK